MKHKDYVFIKLENEKWQKIDFCDIIYVKSDGNFSLIFLDNNKGYLMCNSPLYKLQNILPFYFERVHRSYIINVRYIDSVDFSTKQIFLKRNVNLSFGSYYRENIEKYFIQQPKKKITKSEG